ncbi:hypothetical protein ACROYT_G016151 [Oculina patagonica]
MESSHLPDNALSASTYHDARYIPQRSRLNTIPASGKLGAWCTRTNNGKEWLQVHFGRETTVSKVATQGRYDSDNWVTSYSLSYSVDGSHWAWYRLVDGHIKLDVGIHIRDFPMFFDRQRNSGEQGNGDKTSRRVYLLRPTVLEEQLR